ncbi:helix-turn-helix transcriptional regulator [Lysinibacillus fusiformis]|uniref:helix-turn-helix transcriptional regulator n=1 Tax=Lysinibacillus fusiformis TaxID=28031 RepID=UPI0018807AD9|nr:helix-turn-helix transcriptional regulator [Lysinibacillus fusiformis]MBD8519831.1 helix-turn-helix transcriptional regulator [Lysinibacillus fusiformis]
MDDLENRLKKLREQHHFTQDEVAEYLNISRQAVSKWELGKGYPDIDNFIKLGELYQISLDELITGKAKFSKVATVSVPSNHKTVGDFLWHYWWLAFPILAILTSAFYK